MFMNFFFGVGFGLCLCLLVSYLIYEPLLLSTNSVSYSKIYYSCVGSTDIPGLAYAELYTFK
ncbi:hypothetical protein BO71DRAFT_249816 [Aspergillus ellipticus CBS 707.79]|uniref:Uncharacterized protein n=1 Tax=Aspergillus ellipticus CBS 707.79 TaxID=1448320 RepID=A0A319D8R1_9EURO|nr:hypothetical protein BO71DRAFT_249816 [Aspergillus ellipticus CBS 707.79]